MTSHGRCGLAQDGTDVVLLQSISPSLSLFIFTSPYQNFLLSPTQVFKLIAPYSHHHRHFQLHSISTEQFYLSTQQAPTKMTKKKTEGPRTPKTPAAQRKKTDAGVKKARGFALKKKAGSNNDGAASPTSDSIAPDHDGNAGVTKTRHGRQVHFSQQPDSVYGNDMDVLVEKRTNQKGKQRATPDDSSSSAGKGSLDERFQGLQINSSSAEIPDSEEYSYYNSNNAVRHDSVHSVQGSYKSGDRVLAGDTTSKLEPPHPGLHNLDIDQDTRLIVEALQSATETAVDLPTLSKPTDPDEEEPYTAKTLTHLYLLCYEAEFWNGCDLIADTWIRALHDLRDHPDPDARRTHKGMLWRRNAALERQKAHLDRQNRILRGLEKPTFKGVGFCTTPPPDYELVVADPKLTDDVTMYNANLLNEIYANTPIDCGARLLWSDAMVLCGDAKGGFYGITQADRKFWHEDLVFDVLQTALRLARRKLTLKIEESMEGSWCTRYHEHAKHGKPCYRETSWKEEEKKKKKEAERKKKEVERKK